MALWRSNNHVPSLRKPANCQFFLSKNAGSLHYQQVPGIQGILSGHIDHYTTTVQLRSQPWILLIAPLSCGDKVTGGILSLEKIVPAGKRDLHMQKDMYLSGYTAQITFQDVKTENALMNRQIELAKKNSLSDRPILILGRAGTEQLQFAQAIHNNSRRKPGPFLCVRAASLPVASQEEILFGIKEKDRS